ncbi:hypothetical protein Terro_3183 [Terriglobus roseus DSM 18391]|uniref:Uncharacterized protein n=1 Tax=Terriglobus roseus (strain DSM 18391 / NRRL B-41598 / KBS 63) TaxID=926566 RepID=I3ZJI7_TERRK|nr:hypothetical protein Terro_3183 [Terriglobus roseus DSM 18391]
MILSKKPTRPPTQRGLLLIPIPTNGLYGLI